MNYRTFRLVAPLLTVMAVAPFAVQAQAAPLVTLDESVFVPQRPASEKSPALGALLSWLAFPGVGSYYAGNSAHGTRHVLIGATTLAGAIVLLATCDNDGFCDFDNDAARLTTVIGLAAGYAANSIWSIITAVNDVEDYNYGLRQVAVSLAPAVRGERSLVGDRTVQQWQVRVLSARF